MNKQKMWTCPECGRQFVTANTWHSCGYYDLEEHFSGKDPIVRQIFTTLVEAVEQAGPVTVYAQKTRIVFQVRTRFAAIFTRRRWLILQIWLKRQAEHLLLQRVERYTYRDFGHVIRIQQPEEIDDQLIELLHESYAMGSV